MATKNRPSPSESAQDHRNKIMIGNDGNKYISLPDKNGVYRWKIYYETYDFTKLDSFEINVNNSVLVIKDNFECFIKNGILYINFANELIPEINKMNVSLDLNKISKNLFVETNNPKYSFVQLSYKNLFIQINFSYKKKDKQFINELNNISSIGSYFNIDTILHNKIHHYGEMILLNLSNIKNLKKGKRYIIVYGSIWNIDYAGFSSLAVLDYNDFYYDKYLKKYVVDGIIYTIENNKLIQYNAAEFMSTNTNCGKSNECYFGHGKSFDPIHLIVQLRKDIKLHNLFKRI
ncbi:hypothetical protein Catovirus_1_358 [Catovirus CTV1]|uniref:Uncharacterized protein n=1 Tax=Catovirus CTV1 TaxID=1977631 RepID=A0A1V0S9I0_9VIRU|nr:hypothetical protein Catovirus_1_358 [Catovirus CTV1]